MELVMALKHYHEVPTIQNQCNIVDALCDIQVVLEGAWIAFGYYPIKDECMAETHRSNMSKLDDKGNPVLREDGKFLKGPNYFKPDYYPIIKRLLEGEA